MAYQIAHYLPSDQQDLLEFFRAVLTEVGFNFTPEKAEDLRHVPEVYQSNGGVFLLARSEGQVIGSIALRQINESTCELKRFYVRHDCRRTGVGTALLDKLLSHARAGSWASVLLDTSSKSPAALRLFRKHGFVEIPRYNQDLFADIFLELRLR